MLFFDEDRRRIGKTPRDRMFAEQKGRCFYCGIKLGQRYLHVDHKMPVSRGGKDTPGNLQLLCQPCNGRKSTMSDGEFRKRFKLTPSRQAKNPPTKVIPQEFFDDVAKERAKRKRRSGKQDSWW